MASRESCGNLRRRAIGKSSETEERVMAARGNWRRSAEQCLAFLSKMGLKFQPRFRPDSVVALDQVADRTWPGSKRREKGKGKRKRKLRLESERG
jgi:hypothetical protein